MKNRVLLHSCCGPCSTVVIQTLSKDYDVTVFYYNPNVEPYLEYEKRKEEQIRFIQEYNSNIKIIIEDYENDLYKETILEFKELKEKSIRCYHCFKLRMEKTALYASLNGYDAFDTTLSVSPHKSSKWVLEIGQELSKKYNIEYLEGNYKKNDGYKKSIEFSKQYDLYRQDYCGCLMSKNNNLKNKS